MTKDDIIKKLKTLKPKLMADYKVRYLGLFGSWAIGKQKAKSDIDILVEFEEKSDLFDWIGLNLYLEEIFKCSVDVVTRNALRNELRKTVLENLIKI